MELRRIALKREDPITQIYRAHCLEAAGDEQEVVKLYNLEEEEKKTKVHVDLDLDLPQMEHDHHSTSSP